MKNIFLLIHRASELSELDKTNSSLIPDGAHSVTVGIQNIRSNNHVISYSQICQITRVKLLVYTADHGRAPLQRQAAGQGGSQGNFPLSLIKAAGGPRRGSGQIYWISDKRGVPPRNIIIVNCFGAQIFLSQTNAIFFSSTLFINKCRCNRKKQKKRCNMICNNIILSSICLKLWLIIWLNGVLCISPHWFTIHLCEMLQFHWILPININQNETMRQPILVSVDPG